jgi:hypothetical protein
MINYTSPRWQIAVRETMGKGTLLLFIICLFQITYSETFLEKQKRIAEEQWKREQQKQEQHEATSDGEGGEAEYYYYYETDENPSGEYEYEVEEEPPPPPPPKKNGYQKASATFTKQPAPFSTLSFVAEYQDKLNCLTQKELNLELDRVVCSLIFRTTSFSSHEFSLAGDLIQPRVHQKENPKQTQKIQN